MAKTGSNSDVYKHTRNKIREIQRTKGTGSTKALLANLRRGVGKDPGAYPELWGVLLEGMPDSLAGPDERIRSNAEKAVYNALTLFAMAQQSEDVDMVLKKGEGKTLGAAAGLMVREEPEAEERVLRRMKRIVSSNTLDELAVNVRSFVQLLKGKGLYLDFPMLAEDFYFFSIPEARERVRMKWARDLYQYIETKAKDQDSIKEGETDE